jgi:hypothetical protein
MIPPVPTPRPPLAGRAEFRTGVVAAVAAAATAGEREMCWVDVDFADWPLDDNALLDALTPWARAPQRRLTLLAHHYDEMPRRHPRFVAWRRTWGHLLDCRAAPSVDPSEMPCLLFSGKAASLQIVDKIRWRGRWLETEADRRSWGEVVDAILQRSEDAFPANNLGL